MRTVSETFENRDMAGAVFRNVNLHRATFDDVNLEGASIRIANLKDFSIDDAYIEGLTIYGLRVDQLVEAELDRRDPERLRLRMADPHDPDSVLAVMKRLDEVRGQFRQTLRASDVQLLTTSPGPGRWSVLEIVRHLLFAEDLYLNRWILRNDAPWNPLGQKPTFLEHAAAYDKVGSAPTDDLETVLAAWEALHAQTWEFLADLTAEKLRQDTSDVDFGQRTVGNVLQGLARHDLEHIRDAEALLDELGRAG
jgi:uncharacterized protein YjbI with pentapeptide repeats